MNRRDLTTRLGTVTSELLREKGYISFVDLFIKLGYLDPKDYKDWRRRRIPFLERVIKINLSKISFIVKTVRKSCLAGNLEPCLTEYKSWGKGKKTRLRFSKSGRESIESTYSTHFVPRRDRKAEETHREKEAAEQTPWGT